MSNRKQCDVCGGLLPPNYNGKKEWSITWLSPANACLNPHDIKHTIDICDFECGIKFFNTRNAEYKEKQKNED